MKLFGLLIFLSSTAWPVSPAPAPVASSVPQTISPYAEPVAYQKDVLLNFGNFAIKYLGRETFAKKNSNILITRDNFMVLDLKGKEKKVVVSSGQLPPQPVNFKVDGREYRLLIFAMPNGERLYPGRLAIFRKRY